MCLARGTFGTMQFDTNSNLWFHRTKEPLDPYVKIWLITNDHLWWAALHPPVYSLSESIGRRSSNWSVRDRIFACVLGDRYLFTIGDDALIEKLISFVRFSFFLCNYYQLLWTSEVILPINKSQLFGRRDLCLKNVLSFRVLWRLLKALSEIWFLMFSHKSSDDLSRCLWRP